MALKTETCTECGEVVVDALVEPDARPVRFNAKPQRFFLLLAVTDSFGAARPIDVHEPHSATCKAINR